MDDQVREVRDQQDRVNQKVRVAKRWIFEKADEKWVSKVKNALQKWKTFAYHETLMMNQYMIDQIKVGC